MSTVLGVIADDITGASDIAALLARSGTRVTLRFGVPEEPATDTAAIEVVALKIRTIAVDEAITQARTALRWLQQAGAKRFFWKYCSTFDSTAEGNIGPVAEALMADLGASQTIYCPAFPENGRSVFMGNLFVGRQPLAESPMKDHPLTPMRDSSLVRLLAPQVKGSVGLVDRPTVARGPDAIAAALAALARDGMQHAIVDAIDNGDLEAIAAACRDMVLMTGGSALAMPLPSLYAKSGLLSRDAAATAPPSLAQAAILLSGSCSAMTNRQVRTHLATGAPGFRLDPLTLADTGTADALEWLRQQDLSKAPLLYATAEPDAVAGAQQRLGVARAGAIVEEALAELAVAARDLGARRFVVTGGETSGAVARALGVIRLDIGREIAPGVPWCFAQSGGARIALALKSGNFGTETFLSDALNALEAA